MIKTWAVTDTGLVRKENQDTYRIARNGDICVVCDGMGGAAGGSFIPEERACFLPLDFAVVAGGKAVGGVGFVLGTDVERFGAKIGFWLSSRCRGRGMMTAAVRQAVEWMFANTPIIRIFAAAYATNSASQRVLVKAGFRHVGTFRKAFFKNGAFVDGCYYELLKDENE